MKCENHIPPEKDYFTHNTAYHKWIIGNVRGKNKVLDVGCGDGLLVKRLSPFCAHVVGIDNDEGSIERAKLRNSDCDNTELNALSFEKLELKENSFDAIIFAASLHHMDMDYCFDKASKLLAPGGVLLVVGCYSPKTLSDMLIEALRVIPAKIGSILHGEKKGGEIGVVTMKPEVTLGDVKASAGRKLTGYRIRLGLYYRYLLKWEKK